MSSFFRVSNRTSGMLQEIASQLLPIVSVAAAKEFAFPFCIRVISVEQVLGQLPLIDASLFVIWKVANRHFPESRPFLSWPMTWCSTRS
jgi:hypothetical protein